MAEPVVYEGLCPSPTCEWPSSPEYHTPWCQHATRQGEHHHTVNRSQGGHDEPQAFLCVACHQAVHEGKFSTKVKDGIFRLTDKSTGEELSLVRVSGDWCKDTEVRFYPMRPGPGAGETEHPPQVGRTLSPGISGAQAGAPPRGRIAAQREVQMLTTPASGPERMVTAPTGIYSEMSWAPPAAGLTYEAWEEVGRALGRMVKASGFWVGDWIDYGEHAFGEKYAQALSYTGLKEQTLMNLASVARSVKPYLRREVLSWSHHALVAKLPEQEQDTWLETTASSGMTVAQLRKALRVEQEAAECEHDYVARCRKCGEEQP